MLCCLIGALLAGNLFAAWRIVVAAARRGVAGWLFRGALVGAITLAPVAVVYAAFGDRTVSADGEQASVFGLPCLGDPRVPDR